jgi:PAS domain S-box-containing protein
MPGTMSVLSRRQTTLHVLQGITFALFLVALVTTVRHALRLDRWQRAMEDGRTALNYLSMLRTSSADAEAASLQYVMTGSELHLEPYDAEQLEIRDTLPRLIQHMTNLNYDLSGPRAALERELADKTAAGAELHALRHNRGYDAAQLFVLTGKSQELDERVRARLNELSEAVLRFQDEESGHIARLGRSSIRWLTATAVACLALIVLLSWEARHPQRRREMAVLQNLAEHSASLVRLTDAESDAVYVNRTWQILTGRPAVQLLDWEWLTTLHPDDRPSAIAAYRDAVTRRESRQATYRVLRPDGTQVLVTDTLTPVFDDRGHFEGLACFASSAPRSDTPDA